MPNIWQQVRTILEPPKHPGDAKPKSEPISEELEAARADWQSEKTLANAARYITLRELSIRSK